MALRMICGKPGHGKGLVSVQEAVTELVQGEGVIIGTLALRVEPWCTRKTFEPRIGLRNYLLREFGKDFDVRNRVKILDDEDGGTFFLHRRKARPEKGQPAEWLKSDCKMVTKGEDTKVVSFDTAPGIDSGRHMYFVDEAWHYFGSRSWQKTGEGLLYYNAQHRRFGDDVFFVTQNTKQIDPAVHRLCQEFWKVKNHAKMVIGWFKRPAIFTLEIYEDPPNGSTQRPMTKKVFKLDVAGLAQCYDTSAGVGFVGGGTADLGERRRGLPFWLMPAGVVVAGLLCWYALRGVSWGLGRALVGSTHQMQHAAGAVMPGGLRAAPETPGPSVPLAVTNYLPAALPPAAVADETNNLFCKGFIVLNRVATIMLSDGSCVDSTSGRVTEVKAESVTVDGVKLAVRRGNVVYIPPPVVASRVSSLVYEPPSDLELLRAMVSEPVASVAPASSIQVTAPIGRAVARPRISGLQN
jgi:hypothetical protein